MGSSKRDARFDLFASEHIEHISRRESESTRFGHLRGAFTGAATDKRGSFDLAAEARLLGINRARLYRKLAALPQSV